MKILDRYIAKTIIGSTLFVVLVLVGIQSFLSLVQQFRHIGVGQYSVWEAILFVPMQLPIEFYQLFPMAGFLGCLVGLGRLATSSQLIVIRASGVSIGRIATSVLKAAIPMIICVTVIGEGFGPIWQRDALQMRQKALNGLKSQQLKSVWMRSGNNFTHISHVANGNRVTGVSRYLFDDHNRLIQASFANAGRLKKDSTWILYDLSDTNFLKDSTTKTQRKTQEVNLLLKPNLQIQIESAPEDQTIFGLYKSIKYRFSIGLSANKLIYSLWQRLLTPFTSLIMICLGVPFVFGSLRSSSMGMRVLIGIVVGFGFYMLNQLFGPITLVYQYPPFLAAVTPTMIFTALLLFLLARLR